MFYLSMHFLSITHLYKRAKNTEEVSYCIMNLIK